MASRVSECLIVIEEDEHAHKGKTDGLTSRQEEGSEGPEDVVLVERRDEDRAEHHEGAEQLRPEEDREAAPEVERRDPHEPSDAEEKDIAGDEESSGAGKGQSRAILVWRRRRGTKTATHRLPASLTLFGVRPHSSPCDASNGIPAAARTKGQRRSRPPQHSNALSTHLRQTESRQ